MLYKAALYLVACSKGKAEVPSPAKDLYTSDLFRSARAYVEKQNAPWSILSAKHGLVSPDIELAPYDLTLTTLNKWGRYEWAQRVYVSLQVLLSGVSELIFLAGTPYRKDLIRWIQRDYPDLKISMPLQGLGIGQQLAWLKARVA